MKFTILFAILFAVVAAVSALPNSKRGGEFVFDTRCERIRQQNGEEMFETTEYTDCTPKGTLRCRPDLEICCKKRTGGSKCVALSDLSTL